jgi:glycosyltransferase involved in cell wall biosynthesis
VNVQIRPRTEPTAPAVDPRLAKLKRIAIVPAFNEEDSIASVIAEIRTSDPDLEIVVIDDGSRDRTAAVARSHGAHVLALPFNLGIGGAMQTGFQYARQNGFDLAVQIDGDGQHVPSEVGKLVEPILDGRADLVVGTRFVGEPRAYHGSVPRRLGIQIFAGFVSLLVGRRVTDTTSGFRAANRRAIILFAADYPHDYPEVEAMVLVHRHKLSMTEVPVTMRTRSAGRSSITALRAIYYMVKVSLALFVSLFRRYSTPLEEP